MKTKLKSILLTLVFSMIIPGVFSQTEKTVMKATKSQNTELKVTLPPVPPEPPAPPDVPGLEQEAVPPLALVIPDLTNDQKQQLKKLDLKNLEAMNPIRNQMREKKVHLMSLLSTQPMNMKEAESVADEIGKIQASILKQQIRHDQEIRGILTHDQQVIFDSKPKPFLRERMRLGR
ncbi:MAG: periplasmic heavy metal sensor [Bacteroidetes bacterium]|nr:periplasmic heavy metal sensor [Bacteroidota bacterium]